MRIVKCVVVSWSLLSSGLASADEKTPVDPPPAATPEEQPVPATLDFEMPNLDGEPVKLADYQGKVVLMVNVASQCGATPQYAGLQELYEKYEKDGLVVLGFPCNQFGAQEPGTSLEIREFCTKEYAVTFPLFEKIDVNGPNAAPLYQHLTAQETKPAGKGRIGWNFEKFLIGKDGEVLGRYGTGTEPADLEESIQSALKAE